MEINSKVILKNFPKEEISCETFCFIFSHIKMAVRNSNLIAVTLIFSRANKDSFNLFTVIIALSNLKVITLAEQFISENSKAKILETFAISSNFCKVKGGQEVH